MIVGLRAGRIELDELWAYVGKKQKRVTPKDSAVKSDQYTFVALASSARAILSYHTGKRDAANTELFIHDLRERVIGAPEISSDGWNHYQPIIRATFSNRVAYGQINKTYAVMDLRDAAHRYSPAAVVAVSREVVSGVPDQISTSYVEQQHLTLWCLGWSLGAWYWPVSERVAGFENHSSRFLRSPRLTVFYLHSFPHVTAVYGKRHRLIVPGAHPIIVAKLHCRNDGG